MERRSDRIDDRFDRRSERIQNRFYRRIGDPNQNISQQMYGGTNPYMQMYKQGGEYYMDEDTINMILAMGGDIEFLD